MSGGAWNYDYYKLESLSNSFKNDLKEYEISDLLKDLADLAHDTEWYLSGDYDESDYRKAADKFKTKWFKGDRDARLKDYIDKQLKEMKKDLYNLIG